jgi:DNA-binding PadR family transcriptional regulator
VGEGPTHGFAVARLLDAGAPLGRVWTVRRPDVYQAVKRLLQLGLIESRSTEPGARGPARTVLVITPSGRRRMKRWLAEPVDHVRDVRSLLLLKLALLDRAGADASGLVEVQRERLLPHLRSLEDQVDSLDGFERVLAEWRMFSSQATVRFLDELRRRSGSTRGAACR